MKILIVEDEFKIAKSLKRGLEEEQFIVETVGDGIDAYNKITNWEYDLIILDLMIPRMSGIEVLEKMRENKIYTPVIILTAKDSVRDKVHGLNNGADDYLAKPFSFEELLARIRSLIRRATTKDDSIIIDDLEFNSQKNFVKRSGQDIELTRKEFQLLEYLIRNKGFVLSEEKILNHVWDYDYMNNSNIVAATVKNLRLKIDKKFHKSKSLIKNIRGLGYKIDG